MPRAAVLGSPISHSRSPDLHRAAYAELGLDWTYEAIECNDRDFAAFFAGLDEHWRGLSLTMPLKEVVLDVVEDVDDRARRVHSANTVWRTADSSTWRATNTDIPGICSALGDVGVDRLERVRILGAGATARSAVAAVADTHQYARLLVTRPPISLGKDIGYLPGTLEEKLGPWMKPIIDNIDFITGSSPGEEAEQTKKQRHREPRNAWADLQGMGLLEVEAINTIRGRSIPHQFLVVDEAQNLTPLEVKTIVTRVGEGTKVVFTGDPYQIDNPYVDAESNGLTWLVEKLKGQPLVGHMTLTKGERSELAELAANIL